MSEKLTKKRVSVTLTRPYLDAMQVLVEARLYESRAELLRAALRRLFRHYALKPFAGDGGGRGREGRRTK